MLNKAITYIINELHNEESLKIKLCEDYKINILFFNSWQLICTKNSILLSTGIVAYDLYNLNTKDGEFEINLMLNDIDLVQYKIYKAIHEYINHDGSTIINLFECVEDINEFYK